MDGLDFEPFEIAKQLSFDPINFKAKASLCNFRCKSGRRLQKLV